MGTTLTVTATIGASRKKTWDYYTQPEHITQWNFADPSWHCPSASNDLQPGGTYKARMEAKDGSFGFDFEAVYDSVQNGESFAYSLTDGRKASVHFSASGDQTLVEVRFEAEDQHPIEMQQAGWQAILNSFKHYTESH